MEAASSPGATTPFDQEPDWLRAGGWQRTDDAHPPGEGDPAYRVVYKTLRVVLPNAELSWPNLRVRFGHGSVHRGGMSLPGAIPARTPHRWVLPEYGRLVPADEGFVRYQGDINKQYQFAAWEDEVADVFFVELLLRTEAVGDDAQLAEGRSKLASLKVLLELRFGT